MRLQLRKSIPATLGVALAAVSPLSAQFLELRGGRAFTGPDFSTFSMGYAPIVWGPFSLAGSLLLLEGSEMDLYGAGLDASLTLGPRWRALLGGSGGFGSGTASGDWASWTVGAGLDLLRRPFALGVEGRYRTIGDFGQKGAEVNLRVAIPLGRSRPAPVPQGPHPSREEPPLRIPPAVPVDDAGPEGAAAPLGDLGLARAQAVVDMARSVMGTPYLWGGTDANGFDCSGLIQHAYASVGVALPRTSALQSRAGREVVPQAERLQPGDILVFGGSPDAVTHVGLYIGDREFIHSSRLGVRTSRLSRDDPDGRWWVDRWLGARRVLQ